MIDYRNSMTRFVDASAGTVEVSRKPINRAQSASVIADIANVESRSTPKWIRAVESDVSVFPGQAATAKVIEKYHEETSNAKLASQWTHHLFSVHSPTDVDAISETVEYVFEAFAQLGPSVLDLRGIASNNVNAEHLVAVLRATNANKHVIPGWAQALKEAPDALRRAGLDPAEVLVGLN